MMGKRILFLANEYTTIVNFRMELIRVLILNGHEVFVAIPQNVNNSDIKAEGCEIVNFELKRKGINPFEELLVIKKVKMILEEVKPDIVFTFTIKPNIYGGIACSNKKIPYVANITGLGTAIENNGILQKIGVLLYKRGLIKAQRVFFQNAENMEFMISHKIIKGKYTLLPGSGVNLEKFNLLPYPKGNEIHFMYFARVMKEKGIEQYIEAAREIRKEYVNVSFHICGMCEQGYKEKIKEWENEGIIIYHGQVKNVPEMHRISACTIHPSFYPEGMSNVLLESAACGRPIITTNRSGCREIIEDGINGYIVNQRDSVDLIKKIRKFLSLSSEEREKMGLNGRRKVELEFDRKIVIEKYLEEINSIL